MRVRVRVRGWMNGAVVHEGDADVQGGAGSARRRGWMAALSSIPIRYVVLAVHSGREDNMR